ncbi:MAG: hypothetical protein HRT58_09975 [Crocinitomicaceae bacterium]|nr:hypothetical protein [Flavobacteriales bacterium]NQZ35981.1 hypothetical protein [Crocinitomicaceae bacterium]PHR35204.1 MAG: hypothetical protein COA38_02620 [Fluviicola sp.]
MQKLAYYENEFCEYWIDERGIVHEIFKDSFKTLDLEVAKVITQDRLMVSNGIARPLYVELGKATKMNRAANAYLSKGIAMECLSATGILVRDQIEKFGANLYTGFFKPSVPTKFFTDKDKALVWLRNYTQEVLN